MSFLSFWIHFGDNGIIASIVQRQVCSIVVCNFVYNAKCWLKLILCLSFFFCAFLLTSHFCIPEINAGYLHKTHAQAHTHTHAHKQTNTHTYILTVRDVKVMHIPPKPFSARTMKIRTDSSVWGRKAV